MRKEKTAYGKISVFHMDHSWTKASLLWGLLSVLPWGGEQSLAGLNSSSEQAKWGFPDGAVVENLPANAGDTGSSPGLGRSHMPRSNQARAPQLLSLHSRTCEPQLLKPAHLEPVLRNKRSHLNEKPAHRNEE